MFHQTFSLHASVISCKKLEFGKMICFKTQKTYLEPLFNQKPQCKVFLKNIIWVSLKTFMLL